jgi:hypothetical protein
METLFATTFAHQKHQDLVVTFEALQEDLSIDGQFSEAADVKWVKDQLRQGNEAAWFCAKVTVSLRGHGIEATDYLGACSYKSFNDFTDEKDGYFVDMVNGLTDQLIPQLKDAMGKIESVLTALEQK